MKLNMAIIDQRAAELEAEKIKVTAQRITDEIIKSILDSMVVKAQPAIKIEWGTQAYNAQSYDTKKRLLDLEGLKTMGAFL